MVTTIDLDSHLREEYFLDEVYDLEGAFADKTPKKIAEGKYPIDNKYDYSFFPWTEKEEKSYNHDWVYHPDEHYMDGEMAARQVGGRRFHGEALELVEPLALGETLNDVHQDHVGVPAVEYTLGCCRADVAGAYDGYFVTHVLQTQLVHEWFALAGR